MTTTGTGVAEILIGGLGNDTLTGGGGADVIRSGAGDDSVTVADLTFSRVDGGSGTDTLALAGSGLALDLTDRIQAAKIDGIERVDLTGSGNNALTLNQLAVINETPASGSGTHILAVKGDAGDAVNFAESRWASTGSVTDASGTFDRYVFGNAEARVEQGIAVSFSETLDLATLTTTQGFRIFGADVNGLSGWSVSSAGDVNGDGLDDVIVGAWLAAAASNAKPVAGESNVILGTASGLADIDLATLTTPKVSASSVPMEATGRAGRCRRLGTLTAMAWTI